MGRYDSLSKHLGWPVQRQACRQGVRPISVYGVNFQYDISKQNVMYLSNVVLMMNHRPRRWPNIKPILLQCLVVAGHWRHWFVSRGCHGT